MWNALLAAAWNFELSQGLAQGISPNAGIYKGEARLGVELRVAEPLGVRLESAFVRFVGSREDVGVGCVGLTLQPLLSWHFLRLGDSWVSFDFGLGGAWFSRRFPPGGTALNGYSSVGLGAHLSLRPSLWLALGVRAFHHSNGRGIVADNPAFDGVGLNLGVATRWGL